MVSKQQMRILSKQKDNGWRIHAYLMIRKARRFIYVVNCNSNIWQLDGLLFTYAGNGHLITSVYCAE